jgi:acetyl esterase/lipase
MRVNVHPLYGEKSRQKVISYLIQDFEEYQNGKKRPGVIICPGGGYQKLSEREGEPVALTFLQKGYHAFVLHYSIWKQEGDTTEVVSKALFELAMTVKMIKDHAEEWNVEASELIIVGFSAGAHLAALFSSLWSAPWIFQNSGMQNDILQVKAVVLGYPLCDLMLLINTIKYDKILDSEWKEFLEQSMVAICGESNPGKEKAAALSPVNLINEKTLPTFLWHTADDELVSAENSLSYALRLSQYHIPYELHVFENGVHGLSLANEFTASKPEEVNVPCQSWIPLMLRWLEKR